MNEAPRSDGRHWAWNPGIGPGIPAEYRSLETIFRPECVCVGIDEVDALAALTGLEPLDLIVFRPARLVLHELIVRVTADIAVGEGEEEEVFGKNFRRIATTIRDRYIAPRIAEIERIHGELCRRAEAAASELLAQTLFRPEVVPRRSLLGLFGTARRHRSIPESVQERELRAVAEFRAAGPSVEDPLRRAVYRGLYRILGGMLAARGRLGPDRELLARLVAREVGNGYGSQVIGREIAPLVERAIELEGYTRTRIREAPILVSLKGASAAGKSSVRPMIKQVMRDQGIEPDGYATISPDVWRRLLLDYESLGAIHKYAGPFTSRELVFIDGKLDRYIRYKAQRDRSIPHILVDRFRFDSFSSEHVARVLRDTYAKYVHTMYMYFIVTPPEETVERGWQRALERGRYKAVEDFLGHCVEAYVGMPKMLFKWLGNRGPDYRYCFLDNRVPKGTFPTTIAFGDLHGMVILDPLGFVNIERYQKIDINAASREEVYPPAERMAVAENCGFLKECLRRIAVVDFADPASGAPYLRSRARHFELLDAPAFERIRGGPALAEVFQAIAPELAGHGGAAPELRPG